MIRTSLLRRWRSLARGPQAPRGIRWRLRRTCRTAEEPRPRRTEEVRPDDEGASRHVVVVKRTRCRSFPAFTPLSQKAKLMNWRTSTANIASKRRRSASNSFFMR